MFTDHQVYTMNMVLQLLLPIKPPEKLLVSDVFVL